MRTKHYGSNVMLVDLDSGNQIGECWYVEVDAANKAEAAREIRKKAWEEVDSRINDVPANGLAEICGQATDFCCTLFNFRAHSHKNRRERWQQSHVS